MINLITKRRSIFKPSIRFITTNASGENEEFHRMMETKLKSSDQIEEDIRLYYKRKDHLNDWD